MATYRSLINSVLRRLREDTITADWLGALNDSTDVDEYHQLIGELVNESKQYVEDSWNWSQLRTVVDVTTVADTQEYTISGATDRTRVLQVIDDSNDSVIPQMSDADFMNYKYVGTTTNTSPIAYRLSGNNISFYPKPDSSYTIRVHVVQPQADLTEAATVLSVPELPVVLSAYSLALNERGEDGGTGITPSGTRAGDVLTDAITQDSNRTVDETVWYVS